ncbi:MAG: hypothetical protein AVO35_06540 [Candidatus Aegiribacteria sp. MLS_C]|nr:MAG: hypothetical protein AVO35_06540 [Candidatus Aegiribacteria sp. MLS_C]
MASDAEVLAMRKALRMASKGRGAAFPNPMVGAVVLDGNGVEVGDGFHRKCGEPHAETVALAAAGDRARGGTMVVTLEPCCHQGRTGPCTEKIIGAGISRVVVAMQDPDPRVHGGGIRALEEAGIDVETGILAERAAELNRFYLHYVRTGRSWVTLKLALSLDGRVAAADGGSRWISCEESRKTVHKKRASVSAVMTGAGTVRRDDPRLTARDLPFPLCEQPARVVVTGSGDLGDPKRFLSAPGRIIIALPRGAGDLPEIIRGRSDLEIWELPKDSRGGVDLRELLARTASRGMGEVLCESGPGLAANLMIEGLVDSVMFFTAPILMGNGGVPAIGDLGVRSMDGAIRLRGVRRRRIGTDQLTEGEIVHGSD